MMGQQMRASVGEIMGLPIRRLIYALVPFNIVFCVYLLIQQTA
jgi:hypothetical protein